MLHKQHDKQGEINVQDKHHAETRGRNKALEILDQNPNLLKHLWDKWMQNTFKTENFREKFLSMILL